VANYKARKNYEIVSLPQVITAVEIKTPMTPNIMMVKKFWKNCFFFT